MSSEARSRCLCWTVGLKKDLDLALVRLPGSSRNYLLLPQLYDKFVKPMRCVISPSQWAHAVEAVNGIRYVEAPEQLAALADAGVDIGGGQGRRVRRIAVASVKAAANLLFNCRIGGEAIASMMRLDSAKPPRHLL